MSSGHVTFVKVTPSVGWLCSVFSTSRALTFFLPHSAWNEQPANRRTPQQRSRVRIAAILRQGEGGEHRADARLLGRAQEVARDAAEARVEAPAADGRDRET